jgi:chromosome segregation ATPase
MENLYSWLIICSGATIALLGSFLFASERELRKKRREFDAFKRAQTAKPTGASAESERAEMQLSAELIAKNEEHANEIASLSSRLEQTQRALAERQNERSGWVSGQSESQQLQGEIADLRNQLETSENQLSESARINATSQSEIARLKQQLAERETAVEMLQSAVENATKRQSDNQEICVENQRLQEDVASYRVQLNRSEERFEESERRCEELSVRCARLEEEVSDFEQQLEDSRSKAREIEAAQQQLAKVESREMIYKEQQEKLEVLIVDLERELSEGKSQVQALDETHQRLRETERVCEELADENRRLGEEVSLWQERLAASEESQREVSRLRQQLGDLHSEHTRLADEKCRAQEDLAAHGQAISPSPIWISEFNDGKPMRSTENPVAEVSSEPGKASAPNVDQGRTAEIALPESRALDNGSNGTGGDQIQLSSIESAMAIPEKGEEASWVAWISVNRKWRVGAAAAVVVVIAGVFAMGFLGTRSSTLKELAVAPETRADITEPVAKPQTKPAPRVRGTFETVRATEVYRGPSENSPVIANIAPGMKLNVVNSRNGWLEIRSKHGRPPGFVREEAAVRIGQN